MVKRRTLLKAGGIVGVPAAIGVGAVVFPIRSHLYGVRFDNRRAESVSVKVRLVADDNVVLNSTFDVPPDELLHLPCEWPRAAWAYELAVRPAGHDEWQTITWNDPGKLCKKIVINEADESLGPITFYESSCPTTLGTHSCESE